MVVRAGSGDKGGDPLAGSFVYSMPSPGKGMCRGRFWALAELEEDVVDGGDVDSDVLGSKRPA
jgi:hypothetical protein